MHSLITILLMGISSTKPSLPLLVDLVLHFGQPGGGCLIWACFGPLLITELVGGSTSNRSVSQSEVLYQHWSCFLIHLLQ